MAKSSSALRFKLWLEGVDRGVQRRIGLSVHDLADAPFADWFADGISPAQAAKLVLQEEGF